MAGDRLLFASEIKAILESGLIEARANEAVLPEVLATRATAGDETLFHGIHKLLPGHVLVYRRRARRRSAATGTCRATARARRAPAGAAPRRSSSSAPCSTNRCACA